MPPALALRRARRQAVRDEDGATGGFRISIRKIFHKYIWTADLCRGKIIAHTNTNPSWVLGNFYN